MFIMLMFIVANVLELLLSKIIILDITLHYTIALIPVKELSIPKEYGFTQGCTLQIMHSTFKIVVNSGKERWIEGQEWNARLKLPEFF